MRRAGSGRRVRRGFSPSSAPGGIARNLRRLLRSSMNKIGRASWRGRGENSGGAVSFKKKKNKLANQQTTTKRQPRRVKVNGKGRRRNVTSNNGRSANCTTETIEPDKKSQRRAVIRRCMY